MIEFGVKLENADVIEKQLLKVERKVAKTVVRKALRKASTPTRKAMRRTAKDMVGGEMGALIAGNLVTRAFRRQRRGSYAIAVRIKSGVEGLIHIAKASRHKGGQTYIPAAIEYGHDNVAPIPFMRTAIDTTEKQDEQVFVSELKTGITEAAK